MNKTQQKFRRYSIALSFGVTVFVLLICFACRGVAPLGTHSLCSMDGWSQYYPMLCEMRRAVRSGNLFWSDHGALGFNLWAQSAYYTNSPFWWLLFLLPERLLPAGIDCLVLLRLSLCAVSFCRSLWARFPSVKPSTGLFGFSALSLAWALNGWTLAFINQFMWLDALILLPLLVLFLRRLLHGKGFVRYSLLLALTLWSCFYIGWMVCLFLLGYSLVLLGSERQPWRLRMRAAFRFAAASLCGGALASPVLLPVFFALQKTVSAAQRFQLPVRFSYALWDFPARFAPFQKIALVFEAPNVFCTCGALFLAGCWLFFSKEKLRKKLWITGGACLFVLSVLVNLGDYIWHGLHYPNQLPCRESFLLIFVLLTVAARGLCSVRWKRDALPLLCVWIAAEAALSFGFGFCTQTWISDNDALCSDAKPISAMAEKTREAPWLRCEVPGTDRNNYPMQYGFSGVGYYASTMSADAYRFFQAMGQPLYAENVSTLYAGGDILNAVFGIRYLYVPESEAVFENPYAFPLLFGADRAVAAFDPEAYPDAASAQQTLLRLLSDGKGLRAADLLREEALQITSYRPHKITATLCTAQSYIFTTIPYDSGWRVLVDGKPVPCEKAASYFCAFAVSPGKHELQMRFCPVGLKCGTALCLIVWIFLLTVWRLSVWKQRPNEVFCDSKNGNKKTSVPTKSVMNTRNGADDGTRFSPRTARLGHSRSKQSTGLFLCAAPTSSPVKKVYQKKEKCSQFEDCKHFTGADDGTRSQPKSVHKLSQNAENSHHV